MWSFVLWIGTTILSYLLQPKPEEPSPASLGDFQVPTADSSRSIPVVFGTVLIKDPNTVWYGGLSSYPIKKSGGFLKSDITVGYRYYLGAHLALCYPVDEIQEIKIGDRNCWTGSANTGTITVNSPGLFGGDDGEGGVSGNIDVLMGGQAQAKNTYLMSQLGSVIPAFRGVLSLVFKDFYWGNSPYIKNPSIKVKRTDIQTDFTPQWYDAKANINGGDLNPVHIIRECLTNYQWGMGYPTSLIDDASFTAAADTLYSEGFGLSLKWSESVTIESFIQQINDHIDAVVDTDISTGKIVINLIRGGYDPAALLLIDESNSELGEFERRGWGETVNEITAVYRDRDTGNNIPVTIQDIGNIQIQGGNVVAETHNYPGIPNATMAGRVAQRDLRVKSAPMAHLKINANRQAYSLTRGEVFRYSNNRLGISEAVFRAVEIDRGELTDGSISIDAIEDVFSLDASSYVSPQASGWTSPNTPPVPAAYEQVIEASYWDVQHNVSAADIAQFAVDFGLISTQAVRASGDSYNYQIDTRIGAAAYAQTGTGHFCPTAQLDGPLPIDGAALTGRMVSIKSGLDLNQVVIDTYAYIGAECVAVRAIDTGASTVTIDHGVLDTVPVDHVDGERIWFCDGVQGFDMTERANAETIDVKLLPATSLGVLDVTSAAALPITMATRYQRPYPPGNVKVNGTAYPAYGVSPFVITWAHRDRLLQTADFTAQDAGDIGPEAGTTYTVYAYGVDSAGAETLFYSNSGITGTTDTLDFATDPPTASAVSVSIRISSVRDGYQSYQSSRVDVGILLAPYGLSATYTP